MHGLIFSELKTFVDATLGPTAWPALLDKAGTPGKIYMPIATYPDGDAVTLVTTASQVTGRPVAELLESFGEFIAPDLLRMYASLLDRRWTTLDVLEHTEETIHQVVRSQSPGSRPPELRTTRESADQVIIEYDSPRRMCSVAKGIVRGLARHFGETVELQETRCMLRGAASCRLLVRRR